MKVKLNDVSGDIVKDNDTYILTDNNYLNNLTYSRTFLKPGQKTNGHSHDNEEEVYIFTEGQALMQIDTEYHHASKGDVFLARERPAALIEKIKMAILLIGFMSWPSFAIQLYGLLKA